MELKDIIELSNENIYLLGFLWADGSLVKLKNSNWMSLQFCIIEKDFEEIKNMFKNFSPNTGRSIRRIFPKPETPHWQIKNHWQLHKNVDLSNKFLELGFRDKTGGSCKKLLNEIPTSKQFLFWRGYFDGDGSIYCDKNQNYGISFKSCKNQNWDCLSELLKNLKIKHEIRNITNKNSCGSEIRFHKYQDIFSFFNYIYPNQEYDFGLSRKYNKFQIFCQQKVKNSYLFNEYKGIREYGKNRWYYTFMKNGKQYRMGKFDSKEECLKAKLKKIEEIENENKICNFVINKY